MPQHRVRLADGTRVRLDDAFPEARVAVEADGYAFHSSPSDFVRDRRRRAALAALGWRVLVFTWADVTERPGEVAALVRGALEVAGASPGARG